MYKHKFYKFDTVLKKLSNIELCVNNIFSSKRYKALLTNSFHQDPIYHID